ncbi:hypothetical protein HJC23_013297 [Cyclotella cryptica]|uniref:Steroid 5-alpha reductase C-terminal domain-containing protein n=1 Tax=Cyclotella cryptica TaxID=29204 RepID=A0ABD3PAM0_9STRA
MSSQYFVFGIAAAITIGVQSIGFTLAYALRTEIFYDRTKEGDARFDEVLGKKGGRMKPLTFFVYWMAQAFWVYLISMPLLFINSSSVKQSDFAAYDIAFATLFGCGVLVEIVADIQKAWWVRSGRPGHFCSVGVWSFSRHPNYFGEIFQWWCLWAFAQSSSESNRSYADPLWWACIVSPLFTMHILLNMKPTGLCNAEGENLQRYYDKCPEHYSAYRNSTSILIPMIGYRHVPMLLKRTIFLTSRSTSTSQRRITQARRKIVGSNQIKTVFDPEYERYINLKVMIALVYLCPEDFEATDDESEEY